jgi:mRNA-degrading endonuclease RelE of RelBE toxin-antitoxin system
MKAFVLREEAFITDTKGKRVGVMLDLKTYGRLREAEEDLADIRAYDAARPKVQADLKSGRFSSLADYRVIYEIHDRELHILVITVGHRREVYR